MRTETIGDCTLLLGDCRDILPTLGKVDAVVTDPPYGTENLGGGYGRRQNWDNGDGKGRVIANDADLSIVANVFPMLKELMTSGWVLAFFSPRKTPDFIAASSSLEWFGELVWDKRQPGLGYHIRYSHESIAVFRVGAPLRPDAALFSILRGSVDPIDHPHMKPVGVLSEMVEWAANYDDVVLDPFMGSGTTGVACLRMGRQFIGIEIDPVHYETALRRIEAEHRRPRLALPEPVRAPTQEALL